MRPAPIHLTLVVVASLFLSCGGHSGNDTPSPSPTPTCENLPTGLEAEDYDAHVGQIRTENKSAASRGQAVHIGPDSDVVEEGVGDSLTYELRLCRPQTADPRTAVLDVNYADDAAGNLLDVHVDGVRRGRIRTNDTGDDRWNTFLLDRQKVALGTLGEGSHSLRIEVARGGSFGVLLDRYTIVSVATSDPVPLAYEYVKALVHPDTGLVRSATYDDCFAKSGRCYTTLYKNALAAMAFIHEGDLSLAERIFDFYLARYDSATFAGFTQYWDAETGAPGTWNPWEGDNAFLLLALNYYNVTAGGFGRYQGLVDGLVTWLAARPDAGIVAEGLSDMYAALKPFEATVPGMGAVLTRLRDGFFRTKDYDSVLDHIERGALCFSDTSGFASLERFRRTETWDYDGTPVTAYAGFASDEFVNLEISAQMLLAWKLWRSSVAVDLSGLESELNRLWLLDGELPAEVTNGLPYFLTQTAERGWDGSSDEPIIDPTCYMLFHAWGFNPMAPGRAGS